MKISNTTPNYINQTYTNPNATAAGQSQNAPKTADDLRTDSINLSGRTQDLQKIDRAMDAEPADRQKLVADIKERIENNQYNINAEKVAEKIIGTFTNQFG